MSLSNWPTYLHDPANTSFLNIEMELPTKIIWTHKYEGDPKSDSHKLSDLIVYRNRLYILTEDGYFRALSVETGQEIWRLYQRNYSVWTAPAAKDGQIIWCWGVGKLLALDPLRPKVKWYKWAGGTVTTDIAVNNNDFFYGTNDGILYSQSIKDGNQNWETKLSSLSQNISCIADGRVFELDNGGIDGIDRIYCLDQNNGKIIWKKKAEATGTPALFKSGKIYYGGIYYGGIKTSINDLIRCLDSKDGRVIWSRVIAGYEDACPLAMADSLLVGMNSLSQNRWKLLFMDSADGHSIGELEGDGHITSQIVASHGFLAFGTDRNEIVLVDAKQRIVKSTLAVPGNKPFSLALTRNKLLVGSEDGTITCLGN